MKNTLQIKTAVLTVAAALALGACKSNESKPDPQPQAEAAPASQTAQPAQAAASQAPAPAASTASAAAQDKACKEKAGKNGKNAKDKNAKCKEPAPAAAAVAEAPPAAAPASASGAYNLSKNKPVTDSTKVESGQGTMVKGINDWEGEITGIPAGNSKFTKLKIGMPLQQVFDLVGQPTDQGAYITGKAFIPFYFGSDRSRWETVYKGQGRLIFANQAGFGTGQYLVWIIHNSNEPGYR